MSKEEARRYGRAFQHVQDNVQPERVVNREDRTAEEWWLFRRSGQKLRSAIENLERYIATTRTARHRFFQFLPAHLRAESKIVVVALDDAYYLGVLSSRIHIQWALATGGWLGVGNDSTYNHTDCFYKFPFPAATENEKTIIRKLGEQLDWHRKKRLDTHEDLTMTKLYNVLKKERRGEELGEEEREIHEKGLVGILADLHDELDSAVARAYGWDRRVIESREEILQRLVGLNAKRRAEEEEGHVRYLRPEYQAPEEVETQAALELDIEVGEEGEVAQPRPWPSALRERAQAVRAVMTHAEEPLTVEQVAQHFHRARRDDVRGLLETLDLLGHVEKQEGEVFAA